MKILSVDPGYDRLGVAITEKENGTDVLIFSSCILTDKKAPMHERLRTIGLSITKLIHDHSPTHLAIEKLFFNNNHKTVMAVSEVRGIVIYLATVSGLAIREFGPQEIKVAMTGYGKSDKKSVIDMVKRVVKNAPERALDDEYDAIAIAATCSACERVAHVV